MGRNGWRERIERAEALARQHAFAAEMLHFYVKVAEFQEDLYSRMEKSSIEPIKSPSRVAGPPELSELIARFVPFLILVERNGPLKFSTAAWETLARQLAHVVL